jgi:hypothetical protein
MNADQETKQEMSRIADELKATLLALWLGAALFFSAVVAPAVFGVLHHFDLPNANEIAGSIVTRSLTVINVGGFLIGLLALAIVLVSKRTTGGFVFAIQFLSLIVLALTTALGKWIVAARMVALRTAMVIPIDQVPADDPRHQAFSQLHGYSVALLSAAMIACLVAIVIGRRESGK